MAALLVLNAAGYLLYKQVVGSKEADAVEAKKQKEAADQPRVAAILFANVVDRQNMHQITSAFMLSNGADEFRRLIGY